MKRIMDNYLFYYKNERRHDIRIQPYLVCNPYSLSQSIRDYSKRSKYELPKTVCRRRPVMVASMILSACGTAADTHSCPGNPTPRDCLLPRPVAPATAAPATVAPVATTPPAASNPDTIIIGTTDKVASLDSADAYSTHDWEIHPEHQ